MIFSRRFVAFLLLFPSGCNHDARSKQAIIAQARLKATPAWRTFFTCLDPTERKKEPSRTATLRGADWELNSTINLECLPERDLLFLSSGENPFLRRPIVTRTRVWITKRNDQIYARVLESGASIEQQLVAIAFRSNQKCTQLASQNCRILLVPPARMD